jgi:predicted PurR-regulated permease PerM
VLLTARISASLEKKRLRLAEALYQKEEAVPPPEPTSVRPQEVEVPARRPGPRQPLVSPTVPVRLDLDYLALFKLGGALFLLWFLSKTWSVVALLSVALMLVATLSPIVRRIEARFNRRFGIVLVAVGVVGIAGSLLGILIPPLVRQVQSLVTHFPTHAQTLEGILRRWRVPISLSSFTQGWTQNAAPQIINAASTMLSGFVELSMVAILTIYLLIDGPSVQMSLIRLFPRGERLAVRQVLITIAERIGSYMRGQLLTTAMAGLFSFLLLLACRVPEPLALAVWMAVADAIPLVGLLIGVVPAVLLAMTQGTTTALVVGLLYVLYHQLEVTVLVPRIYGSRMKLSGTAILVSILIGAKLMGVVGALFALPVAAALPILIRYVGQWRDRQSDRESSRLVG